MNMYVFFLAIFFFFLVGVRVEYLGFFIIIYDSDVVWES